jgi:acyl-CoA synthetase (AMP-forming)/AMP-acid ligase II
MTGTSAFVDLVEERSGLGARAKAVAVALMRRGLTGHRVLVSLPPGSEYVATLLGCLYAGVVAVPTSPHNQQRRAEVVADAQPTAAIAHQSVDGLDTLSHLDGDPRDWRRPDIGPDTLALLQYPSGPLRGVMLSHTNLIAGATQLVRHLGMRAGASVVSYLPPYSDLGLVGGVLAPLLTGANATLLAADTTPDDWLRAVSNRRASISFAPELAYAWRPNATPDLSHWDVAVTAAGPDTLERFANLLAPHGFRRQSLFPAYWSPEATALITGRKGLTVEGFDADTLEPGRLVKPGATILPDLGPAVSETDIAIVDPLTATRCPDGTAGEVWVAGPNVAVGYLGRPGASERTFCARLRGSTDDYLRTGQSGFLHGGGLRLIEPQNVLLTR